MEEPLFEYVEGSNLFLNDTSGEISEEPAPSNLQQIFIICRHGARAPLKEHPPPLYTDGNWPNGLPHLTNKGRRQMFELGVYLRRRYSSFLTGNPREVSAICYNRTRCYDSAACLLAGMCPPEKHWVWNPDLLWQPVQIVTDHTDYDTPHDKSINKDVAPFAAIPAGKFSNIKDLYTFLNQQIGEDTPINMETCFIVDSLLCSQYDGKPVPQWSLEIWDTLVWSMKPWFSYFLDGVEKDFARSILNSIKDALLTKDGAPSHQKHVKFHLFSFSDLHVYSVLKLLNEKWWKVIPFGGAVIIERYASETGDRVRIMYLENPNEGPQTVLTTKIENSCSVPKFIDFLKLITK